MFCRQCGKKIKDESAFCPYCGHQIKKSGSKSSKDPDAEKKKTYVVPVVIAVIILVAVVGGIIGYFALSDKWPSFGSIGDQKNVMSDESQMEEDETGEARTEEVGTEEARTEEVGTGEAETEEAETGAGAEADTEEETEDPDPAASEVNMNAVMSVTASSMLSETDRTHSPENIIDGDLAKGWSEGAEGQGIGESIVLNLDDTYIVSGFTINAGYQKSGDLYEKNSRPSCLKVTFSDGSYLYFDLDDCNAEQTFRFPEAVRTSSVAFTIEDVYAGSKYEDTVISELSLF